MTEVPFLSIITINFNNANGLKRTLESIKNQTSKNYEHIIIDGGSTDESSQIIANYLADKTCNTNVSFWCSEKDNGVFNAMNKGIAHATGEYCNFLNSGDYFYDDDVIHRFEGYNIKEDIIYSNALYFTSKKEWTVTYPDLLTAAFFYDNGNLNHQNTLIKTSLQKQHLYLENYKINSDGEFFIAQILNGASFRHIKDIITRYEFETGISTINYDLYLKERKEIINMHFSKPLCNMIDFKNKQLEDLNKQLEDLQKQYDDYNNGYKGILRKMRKILSFLRKVIKFLLKRSVSASSSAEQEASQLF